MKKIGTKLMAIGLTLPIVVALAACGSPAAPAGGGNGGPDNANMSVIEKLNALPHDKQRAEAIKEAKAEGSLSVYEEIAVPQFQAVADAFTKKFGIPVTSWRASTPTVTQRIIQESSANRIGADATMYGLAGMVDLKPYPVFAKYEGTATDNIKSSMIHAEGWIGTGGYLYVPVWNTNNVKPGDEPKSWEDLASPRFDGKIVIEANDSDWFGAVSTYWKDHGKSQSEIDSLWKTIAGNAVVGTGHTAVLQMLGAGQASVNAMNFTFLVDSAAKKGAPVAYRLADGTAPTPAFAYPQGLAIFKDAKHPAAAWLFVDWLLQEGQSVLADQGLVTTKQMSGDTKVKGMTILPFPESVANDRKSWAEKFDALLRGVPVTK